jgi:hypothetical protein
VPSPSSVGSQADYVWLHTDHFRIVAWQANNTSSQSQRAVSLGMLNTIGASPILE